MAFFLCSFHFLLLLLSPLPCSLLFPCHTHHFMSIWTLNFDTHNASNNVNRKETSLSNWVGACETTAWPLKYWKPVNDPATNLCTHWCSHSTSDLNPNKNVVCIVGTISLPDYVYCYYRWLGFLYVKQCSWDHRLNQLTHTRREENPDMVASMAISSNLTCWATGPRSHSQYCHNRAIRSLENGSNDP